MKSHVYIYLKYANGLRLILVHFRRLRYDVRGALTDISQYEPPAGGYENRLDYLSSAEQRAEQLCEQERYYSLYNNDVEEEIYQGKIESFVLQENI